jgi:hypothetical protein
MLLEDQCQLINQLLCCATDKELQVHVEEGVSRVVVLCTSVHVFQIFYGPSVLVHHKGRRASEHH